MKFMIPSTMMIASSIRVSAASFFRRRACSSIARSAGAHNARLVGSGTPTTSSSTLLGLRLRGGGDDVTPSSKDFSSSPEYVKLANPAPGSRECQMPCISLGRRVGICRNRL
jgi:hypothetical protein